MIRNLNQAACNVYSPKAVEILILEKCYRYCFLHCVEFVKYIFFWLFRSVGFEGNVKYAKIASAMEGADFAVFTFAM